MGRSFYRFSFARVFLNALMASVVAFASDTKDEVIKRDHRLIEGVWTIVALEVNGNKAAESDIKKLTVVNGTDGTWSFNTEGKEISQGTSSIDSTTKLKAIDLMPTTGDDKGKQYLGIYELGETIEPAQSPKAIDFTTTVGEDRGKQSFGIYEVGERSMKFCVGRPSIGRPGEFTSAPGSEHIFLTFERE